MIVVHAQIVSYFVCHGAGYSGRRLLPTDDGELLELLGWALWANSSNPCNPIVFLASEKSIMFSWAPNTCCPCIIIGTQNYYLLGLLRVTHKLFRKTRPYYCSVVIKWEFFIKMRASYFTRKFYNRWYLHFGCLELSIPHETALNSPSFDTKIRFKLYLD